MKEHSPPIVLLMRSTWSPFKPLGPAAIFKKHIGKRDILQQDKHTANKTQTVGNHRLNGLGFSTHKHREKKGREVILKIKGDLKAVSNNF